MKEELNTIGKRIRKARKDAGMTQEELAEALNVSFQAVSLWEKDKTSPDTSNLLSLAETLQVSVSSLVEDRDHEAFILEDKIFDWQHMVSFIRHTARAEKLNDTIKALDFAIKAHEGQMRKNSDIPYIYHPLNMACHCFALNIHDDALIAACLLHDTLEDCNCLPEELPTGEECKELVKLVSHPADYHTKEGQERYYRLISENVKAALIKCLDRCNNMTTMSWGLSRQKIYEYIAETQKYIMPLLDIIKAEPAYYNAAWLLKYQMGSMLDIYKRLM